MGQSSSLEGGCIQEFECEWVCAGSERCSPGGKGRLRGVMRPAILIHGPTASGKTALAVELAKRLDGEIVNADAMQVYRDLEILSARPSAEEQAGVAHHMFGHVDAAEAYSAGRWQKDAARCVEEIRARGKVAIIVGGSGLYLSALIDGLAEIPSVPDDVKQAARARVGADRNGAYADLMEVDPEAAKRIARGDRQRIARALEVWMAFGKTLSSYRGAAVPAIKQGEWIGAVLTPQRAPLYARINARVDAMLAAGVLDEARALWDRGLSRELPCMRAHGMPGFCAHLDGGMTLEEAAGQCRRDTRRYAKRQMTWIAHQFSLWPRVPSNDVNVRSRVISALHAEIDAVEIEG